MKYIVSSILSVEHSSILGAMSVINCVTNIHGIFNNKANAEKLISCCKEDVARNMVIMEIYTDEDI